MARVSGYPKLLRVLMGLNSWRQAGTLSLQMMLSWARVFRAVASRPPSAHIAMLTRSVKERERTSSSVWGRQGAANENLKAISCSKSHAANGWQFSARSVDLRILANRSLLGAATRRKRGANEENTNAPKPPIAVGAHRHIFLIFREKSRLAQR